MMKPLLPGACGLLLLTLLLPRTAAATDFDLREREPGPGHRTVSYWWKFGGMVWELTPPDRYGLAGGGGFRLQKADRADLAATARESTGAERDLFVKRDLAAEDAYFRTLLPSGTANVKLIAQRENPLPVNQLANIEAMYTYDLGGIAYRASFMVNRSVPDEDKSHGPATAPAGRPAPAAAPKAAPEYFTVLAVVPQDSKDDVYQAFEALMATARVTDKAPPADDSRQYVSHGMLGR